MSKKNIWRKTLAFSILFISLSITGCSTNSPSAPKEPGNKPVVATHEKNDQEIRALKIQLIKETKLDLDRKINHFFNNIDSARNSYNHNISSYFEEKKHYTHKFSEYIYENGKDKSDDWFQGIFEEYYFSSEDLENLIDRNNASYFASSMEATNNFAMSIEAEYDFDTSSDQSFTDSYYLESQNANIAQFIQDLSDKYSYSLSDVGATVSVGLMSDLVTTSIATKFASAVAGKAGVAIGGAAGAKIGSIGGLIGMAFGAAIGWSAGKIYNARQKEKKVALMTNEINLAIDKAKADLLQLPLKLYQHDKQRAHSWKETIRPELINLKLSKMREFLK